MDGNSFFKDVINQNRSALPAYFLEDAVIRWHCTNEQFSLSEYVQANCDYPGKWKGEIERIEELGSTMVVVGKVFSEDEAISCHVTSFIKLKDDKISELDEYWADDTEAPEWRKNLGIGKALR